MTHSKNQNTISTLSRLLADSYILYLKTQNYHWNVTGPTFHSLHALFEEQYTDLAAAIDEIAERIRALGAPAPGSYSAFADLARIKEENGSPSAKEMIANLAKDQETIVDTAQELCEAAQAAGDEPSADLAIQRMHQHQKNLWMLQAHME